MDTATIDKLGAKPLKPYLDAIDAIKTQVPTHLLETRSVCGSVCLSACPCLCMCVCVYVCMCVCERERDRERESACPASSHSRERERQTDSQTDRESPLYPQQQQKWRARLSCEFRRGWAWLLTDQERGSSKGGRRRRGTLRVVQSRFPRTSGAVARSSNKRRACNSCGCRWRILPVNPGSMRRAGEAM